MEEVNKVDKRINKHHGVKSIKANVKDIDGTERKTDGNPYSSMTKEYVGKDVLIANMPTIFDELVKGVSIIQICKKLGISRQSWYNLVKDNLQFNNMLAEAEQYQAETIRQSLINKCQEQRVIKEKVLPNGRKVRYEEYIPADFNAIKFYLLNKLPEEFKDKQEITIKNTCIEVMIDDAEYDIIDAEIKD